MAIGPMYVGRGVFTFVTAGSSDAGPAIQSAINSAAASASATNYSTVKAQPGLYRINTNIILASNMVYDFTGAVFEPGSASNRLFTASNIANFTIIGARCLKGPWTSVTNPNPGVSTNIASYSPTYAIDIEPACSNFMVSRCYFSGFTEDIVIRNSTDGEISDCTSINSDAPFSVTMTTNSVFDGQRIKILRNSIFSTGDDAIAIGAFAGSSYGLRNISVIDNLVDQTGAPTNLSALGLRIGVTNAGPGYYDFAVRGNVFSNMETGAININSMTNGIIADNIVDGYGLYSAGNGIVFGIGGNTNLGSTAVKVTDNSVLHPAHTNTAYALTAAALAKSIINNNILLNSYGAGAALSFSDGSTSNLVIGNRIEDDQSAGYGVLQYSGVDNIEYIGNDLSGCLAQPFGQVGSATNTHFLENLGSGTNSLYPAKLVITHSLAGDDVLALADSFAGSNTIALNPYIPGINNGGFEIRNRTTGHDILTVSGDGYWGINTSNPVASVSIRSLSATNTISLGVGPSFTAPTNDVALNPFTTGGANNGFEIRNLTSNIDWLLFAGNGNAAFYGLITGNGTGLTNSAGVGFQAGSVNLTNWSAISTNGSVFTNGSASGQVFVANPGSAGGGTWVNTNNFAGSGSGVTSFDALTGAVLESVTNVAAAAASLVLITNGQSLVISNNTVSTNGLVTATVTNGLGPFMSLDALSNSVTVLVTNVAAASPALALVTNGQSLIISNSTVSTNGLVTASVTNGLGPFMSLDGLSNSVLESATNVAASAASLVLVTNGQSLIISNSTVSTNGLVTAAVTNGLGPFMSLDALSNTVTLIATNVAASTPAITLITNGQSIIISNSTVSTNGLGPFMSLDALSNVVTLLVTNVAASASAIALVTNSQSLIISNSTVSTNGLASQTYVNGAVPNFTNNEFFTNNGVIQTTNTVWGATGLTNTITSATFETAWNGSSYLYSVNGLGQTSAQGENTTTLHATGAATLDSTLAVIGNLTESGLIYDNGGIFTTTASVGITNYTGGFWGLDHLTNSSGYLAADTNQLVSQGTTITNNFQWGMQALSNFFAVATTYPTVSGTNATLDFSHGVQYLTLTNNLCWSNTVNAVPSWANRATVFINAGGSTRYLSWLSTVTLNGAFTTNGLAVTNSTGYYMMTCVANGTNWNSTNCAYAISPPNE